jgi:hypothetical protein
MVAGQNRGCFVRGRLNRKISGLAGFRSRPVVSEDGLPAVESSAAGCSVRAPRLRHMVRNLRHRHARQSSHGAVQYQITFRLSRGSQLSDTTRRRRRDMAPIIGLEPAPEERYFPKKSRRRTPRTRIDALRGSQGLQVYGSAVR